MVSDWNPGMDGTAMAMSKSLVARDSSSPANWWTMRSRAWAPMIMNSPNLAASSVSTGMGSGLVMVMSDASLIPQFVGDFALAGVTAGYQFGVVQQRWRARPEL